MLSLFTCVYYSNLWWAQRGWVLQFGKQWLVSVRIASSAVFACMCHVCGIIEVAIVIDVGPIKHTNLVLLDAHVPFFFILSLPWCRSLPTSFIIISFHCCPFSLLSMIFAISWCFQRNMSSGRLRVRVWLSLQDTLLLLRGLAWRQNFHSALMGWLP